MAASDVEGLNQEMQPRTIPKQAQDPGKSEASRTIPFELMSDFLVVIKGRIGDLDGLKFIVDTGTTRSAIDRRLADRLRLRTRKGKITNFDRAIPIERAELPELEVGPIRAEAVTVLVLDLARYSPLAENVDGIMGLDLLNRSKKFAIDFENRTLRFELSRKGDSSGADPLCFLVPLIVQGHSMHLIVDTGSPDIFFFRDRFRHLSPKIRTEGEGTDVSIGRVQATRLKVLGVQHFGRDVATTVFLIDGPGRGALPGTDGVLGLASLHARRVEFDFDAGALHWERASLPD